jgi:hypothetical protein
MSIDATVIVFFCDISITYRCRHLQVKDGYAGLIETLSCRYYC